MPELFYTWGLDVILWFQSWRGPLMEAFALLFHYLGLFDVYLIALPMLYWSVDAVLGRRLLMLLVISTWANDALKTLLKSPRPGHISAQVLPLKVELGYGLPSGHTQNAATISTGLAQHFRRGWFTALMLLYMLLMALSRMVAGAHFPHDVIASLLIGAATVALYAWIERRLRLPDSLLIQIVLVLAAAALMFILHPILIPNEPGESSWGSITPLGLFLGLGLGFVLENRLVRFDAGGDAVKRGGRFLIGIVGIMGLRFVLGALFETLEPADAFQALRYAIIGLWIAFGAPLVFLKLNLATHRSLPTSTE
jgi:membrane-associated phospholipid phosphatase